MFFRYICGQVFTRPHGEEEGANDELGEGDILCGRFVFDELADDDEGEGFLLSGVLVRVFVTFILLRKKARELPVGIEAWVRPLTDPEGLCHVINGGTDCSLSQGAER